MFFSVDYIWGRHQIIHLNDSLNKNYETNNYHYEQVEWVNESFDQLIRIQQVSVLMCESVSHSFNWFVQKHWFIQDCNKWLSFQVNQWIIHSTDFCKHTDSFRNKTSDYHYEWFNESWPIHSNTLVRSEINSE